jgi:hypothetical protein
VWRRPDAPLLLCRLLLSRFSCQMCAAAVGERASAAAQRPLRPPRLHPPGKVEAEGVDVARAATGAAHIQCWVAPEAGALPLAWLVAAVTHAPPRPDVDHCAALPGALHNGLLCLEWGGVLRGGTGRDKEEVGAEGWDGECDAITCL